MFYLLLRNNPGLSVNNQHLINALWFIQRQLIQYCQVDSRNVGKANLFSQEGCH